ncbi:hypothetical protein ACOZ4I_16765 [Haloarcula salina]|uniref:hypothetical protein n=1 Tax=Haloarcula salina TaxID=1429914 RepID=UPI003C6F458B
MGLFDTIRRAVGTDDVADGGGQASDGASAGDSSDDGPTVLDTREMDPAAFREHADTVVENAAPLDFSTDALARLDAAIAENYEGRTAGPDAGETAYTENTVRFGSYLGEVLVRAYDAEWVDTDGRWGVVVSGADDEVTVPVFDVAVRSFSDEPVFAALIERLESTLDLDASESGDDGDGTFEPESAEEREPTAESDAADDTEESDAPEDSDESEAAEDADESDPADTVENDAADADESDVADAVTKPTRLVDNEAESAGGESESKPGEADVDAPGADDDLSETDDDPDYPSETAQTRSGGSGEADAPATEADATPAESADEELSPDRQSPDSPAGSETVDNGVDASESEIETAPEPETETAPEPETETAPEPETETASEPEAETASESETETDPNPGQEADRSPEGTESEADAASDGSPAATDDGQGEDAVASSAAESAPSDGSWDGVRTEHAETAVDFAEFWGEHDLDFSPDSLSRLDDLVAEEWDDERFAETTLGSEDSFDDRAFTSVVTELGSYFGEVLVRHLDGEWTADTDHDAAVVVRGTEGRFAVPVYDVAITSLRQRPVFGRSYDALLSDLGRDGPTR